MTREELICLAEGGPVYLDGATGSNLQRAGMPTGVCPELWVLEHPQVLLDLQRRYVEAGTQILYAPTFSGNRIKLSEYGLAERIGEINTELVGLSRRAADGRAFVAGDLTLTGQSLAPMGNLSVEELIDIYREQAEYLYRAGVDLFVVETMMSLAETRAAVIAIREVCDLPVMASMTFGADGRTLYGTDAEAAVVVLQSLGADVVGVNCSTGPREMAQILRRMKAYAGVPLLAKPNAGLPKLADGQTTYDMEAGEYVSYIPALVEAGASFIGGCCGTTPEYIAGLVEATRGMQVLPVAGAKERPVLATERAIAGEPEDISTLMIGRGIDPAVNEELAEDLLEDGMDVVMELAEDQEEDVDVLAVRMKREGLDEKEMMSKAIDAISFASGLPICIVSGRADVVEAALRRYPGRALVQADTSDPKERGEIADVTSRYGAVLLV